MTGGGIMANGDAGNGRSDDDDGENNDSKTMYIPVNLKRTFYHATTIEEKQQNTPSWICMECSVPEHVIIAQTNLCKLCKTTVKPEDGWCCGICLENMGTKPSCQTCTLTEWVCGICTSINTLVNVRCVGCDNQDANPTFRQGTSPSVSTFMMNYWRFCTKNKRPVDTFINKRRRSDVTSPRPPARFQYIDDGNYDSGDTESCYYEDMNENNDDQFDGSDGQESFSDGKDPISLDNGGGAGSRGLRHRSSQHTDDYIDDVNMNRYIQRSSWLSRMEHKQLEGKYNTGSSSSTGNGALSAIDLSATGHKRKLNRLCDLYSPPKLPQPIIRRRPIPASVISQKKPKTPERQTLDLFMKTISSECLRLKRLTDEGSVHIVERRSGTYIERDSICAHFMNVSGSPTSSSSSSRSPTPTQVPDAANRRFVLVWNNAYRKAINPDGRRIHCWQELLQLVVEYTCRQDLKEGWEEAQIAFSAVLEVLKQRSIERIAQRRVVVESTGRLWTEDHKKALPDAYSMSVGALYAMCTERILQLNSNQQLNDSRVNMNDNEKEVRNAIMLYTSISQSLLIAHNVYSLVPWQSHIGRQYVTVAAAM